MVSLRLVAFDCHQLPLQNDSTEQNGMLLVFRAVEEDADMFRFMIDDGYRIPYDYPLAAKPLLAKAVTR